VTIQAHRYERDGSGIIPAAGVRATAERFSWRAVGGPHRATVAEEGPLPALAARFDALRCPLVLTSARTAAPCWWGFIATVALEWQGVRLSATLDGLANYVTCQFTDQVGGQTVEDIEGPVIDDVSVATYGIWESRIRISQGTAQQALAEATRELAIRRRPVPRYAFDGGTSGARLTYEAWGWWEYLFRRYYATTGTNSVETTAQVAAIVAAVGQVFAGVVATAPSGISTPETRDGDQLAGEIVERLLKAGSTTALRYLATVTPQRWIQLRPEPPMPDRAEMLRVRADRRLRDPLDQPLAPEVAPVGQWATFVDAPPSLSVGVMGDPTTLFVEAAEYQAADGMWRLETRGANDLAAILAGVS
jgi:hypothetical protein